MGMKKKKRRVWSSYLNGLQRTDYSIAVLHAATITYRTRAATKIVQRTFSTGSSMEMRPEAVQVCIDMWKSK